MSLLTDLQKMDTDLKQVRTDTNTALSEKGGTGVSTLSELPLAIRNIPSGSYTLPVASADTLGGVKVGENLSITPEGVLSATGGGTPEILTLTPILNDFFVVWESKHDYTKIIKNGNVVLCKFIVRPIKENQNQWTKIFNEALPKPYGIKSPAGMITTVFPRNGNFNARIQVDFDGFISMAGGITSETLNINNLMDCTVVYICE